MATRSKKGSTKSSTTRKRTTKSAKLAEEMPFAVWAPNATAVSVMGDFNEWSPDAFFLDLRSKPSGIWEGFIPGVGKGAAYKYHIRSEHNGYRVDKADPFRIRHETPPKT